MRPRRTVLAGIGLTWCVLVLAGPAAGGEALSLDGLAHMDWPELEQLYRQAEAAPIRAGYAPGRPIYQPNGHLSALRGKVTRVLWHGKHFCAEDCTLINQWCGLRAIRARVSYGPSWLDGKPSVIMDYSETSRVWADVRDEAREVAPGLFLGIMYERRCPGPRMKMFFALQTQPACDGQR